MNIDGCEHNPETNTGYVREKTFDVSSELVPRFTIKIRVSPYIFEKMKDSDWAQCRHETIQHLKSMQERGLREGWIFRARADQKLMNSAVLYARQWVRNAFEKMQIAEGNRCWRVDPLLEDRSV
jgi:hypothetical protein